jgi:hypothetical protein
MTEQRRYERVAFFCPMHITMMRDGAVVPAQSFDISIKGVGLTAQIELEWGDAIHACFHLKDEANQEIDEDAMGRVAYCLSDEDGNRIGIEFFEAVQESKQPVLTRKINKL